MATNAMAIVKRIKPFITFLQASFGPIFSSRIAKTFSVLEFPRNRGLHGHILLEVSANSRAFLACSGFKSQVQAQVVQDSSHSISKIGETMKIQISLALVGAMAAGIVSSPLAIQAAESTSPHVIEVDGDVRGTHDPSIIKDGDIWYLFATVTGANPQGQQLPIRCSKDLHHWERCGFVFQQIPDWIKKESPETKELWAPDISYFNGLYHLYYAFSAFGKNTSGIALLTNKTLDPKNPSFHWDDQGLVLRSLKEDDFNAIDPNLVLDDHGGAWLAFGSFWGGIKMRWIDPKTGKLAAEDTQLYSLASRARPENSPAARPDLPPDWQAIEAPFIIHHGDYYYLFVSFDLCCRGIKSSYKTMVGRSQKVTGPYVDASGKPMMLGGGTLLLQGNQRWLGPGGESLLQQKEGDIIVFHAYDAKTGAPSLQISTLGWNDGWPTAALGDGTTSGK
jgi:arabinan endo-1,5-alpha-L-arabinosidase